MDIHGVPGRLREEAAPGVLDTSEGMRFPEKEHCTSLWREDGARPEKSLALTDLVAGALGWSFRGRGTEARYGCQTDTH